MRRVLLFLLANVVLIGVVSVLVIEPAVDSLRVVSAEVRLVESRYAALRRLGLEYEDNLREIDAIGQGQIGLQGQLPLILAEVSRLSDLHDLHQVIFVAFEPVYYDVMHLGRILEMRVRTEYEGTGDDVSNFLHDLSDADVVVTAVDVRFEGEGTTRLNLEFSVFVAG